jgi:TonB family protein
MNAREVSLMSKRCSLLVCVSALCLICAAQDHPMRVCRSWEHKGCATVPRAIQHIDPEYTEKALKHKVSGVVTLSLTVLPDGTTSNVKVTRALEKSLDEAAVNAARQWRFEPGTYEGKPVAVKLDVEVSFHRN